MATVRVRVELKKKYTDPDKNFREMFQEFKRRVSNAGILHDYKEHQYFQSKSEKRRKKKRDAAQKAMMESLKERILNGEKPDAPIGLIKKVLTNLDKEAKDKKGQKFHSNDE